MWGILGSGENSFEVVAGATHELVAKAAEVGAILHFLGEYVRDGAFTADVGDSDSAVGDPFSYGVFLILNVAVALGGHVVAPLDAGIVIIVERGGGYTVRNGV